MTREDALDYLRQGLLGRGSYVSVPRAAALEVLMPVLDTSRPMWAARVHWQGGTVVTGPTLWPRETFQQCACAQRERVPAWRTWCPDCDRPFSFCGCDLERDSPWR